MGFNCGIVGLPNVGKSTLYNALTNAQVAAENYPFCTIDPNVGVVPVPDPRLDQVARIVQSAKVVPSTMEFVDIAGLVAGASKGEGLGNKFLANIRETHAIAHVVRCFDDADVAHVNARISPLDDIQTVDTELMLADLEVVARTREKVAKLAKSGDKDARTEQALLARIEAHLGEGKPVRSASLSKAEKHDLEGRKLLTAKPVLYIANVVEDGFIDNPYLEAVRAVAAADGAAVVAVCATIEAELVALDSEERVEFLADMGVDEPGLNRVIRAGHALLGLQTFLSANERQASAWTIPVGATALQAAAKIHTDIARGFIRAEVASFEDFVRCGGEAGAKEVGKMRSEGKDYVVEDADVIRFRFNV